MLGSKWLLQFFLKKNKLIYIENLSYHGGMILDVLMLLVLFNYNNNCETDIVINILQVRDLSQAQQPQLKGTWIASDRVGVQSFGWSNRNLHALPMTQSCFSLLRVQSPREKSIQSYSRGIAGPAVTLLEHKRCLWEKLLQVHNTHSPLYPAEKEPQV